MVDLEIALLTLRMTLKHEKTRNYWLKNHF